jgi:hypothetical protein
VTVETLRILRITRGAQAAAEQAGSSSEIRLAAVPQVSALGSQMVVTAWRAAPLRAPCRYLDTDSSDRLLARRRAPRRIDQAARFIPSELR